MEKLDTGTMFSTYSMYRMIKRFHNNDYRELFREFGLETSGHFIDLYKRARFLLMHKTTKLYFQAYGKKIWEIYNIMSLNTMPIRKIMDETVQQPGPNDMVSQIPMCAITTPSLQVLAYVKFINLPFYITVSEIMMPTILIRNNDDSLQNVLKNVMKINLQLSWEQISDLHEAKALSDSYHMKIRFGVFQAGSADINDCLPIGLSVQINSNECPLPSVLNPYCQSYKAKRSPWPIDCTNYIEPYPDILNYITVSWTPDEKTYVMAIDLVKRVSLEKLITGLANRKSITTEMTKNNIINRSKLEFPHYISLNCPLSKMKMRVPGKSIKCVHVQCFDLIVFIKANRKTPKWICPVCNNPCLYDDLAIDNYFFEIVSDPNLSDEVRNVQILPDGTWKLCDEIKGINCDRTVSLCKELKPNQK